jgi:hypothetical protein
MATKAKTQPAEEQITPDAPAPETQELQPIGYGKQPTRLKDAAHISQRKSHTADVGEVFEQMMNPATFAHVAKELRVGDQIEVHAADGTWFGELYVRSVGRNEVYTAPIRYIEFEGAVSPDEEAPYAIMFRGPHMKWCVIARETKAVIRSDFDTEAQAGAWVAQHLKALAA